MKLLKGEEVLFESKKKNLILTNFRVYKNYKLKGKTEVSMIPMSELSHYGFKGTNYWRLLVIGVPLVLCGLYASTSSDPSVRNQFSYLLMFSGIAAIVAYFKTKRQWIEFVSNGGTNIRYDTKSGFESCSHLIDLTCTAKLEREFVHGPQLTQQVNPSNTSAGLNQAA